MSEKLSPGYTKKRPVGGVSQGVQEALDVMEIRWVGEVWAEYTGRGKDRDFFVHLDVPETPTTKTRVWVMDMGGPDEPPVMILPSEY